MITSGYGKIAFDREARILVVDDDPVVLDLLQGFVTSFGHECVRAADGLAALDAMAAQSFEIVITDMVMPNMDGMELLREIKTRYPETDVIVVTGHPATFSFTDVIRAGAVDFIVKPFLKDELEAKINRVLRERFIIRQLEQLSMRDPLTDLENRRAFDIRIRDEVVRAHRQKYPLFLAMIDVDHFKSFNDTMGHPAGDRLLREVADIMSTCVRRKVDLVFRYGGDEFAIVFPHIDRAQAEAVGRRLLRCFAERPRDERDQTGLSIGIAQFVRREGRSLDADIEDCIGRADRALYAAKHGGRDQLCMDEAGRA